MMAAADAFLAAQNAVISASSMGIDSLVNTGIHRTDQKLLYKLLNLPEKNCFPVTAVVFGYPTKEPSFKKGRLNGPAVIHKNQYKQPGKKLIEQIVQSYDEIENHLTLNNTWKEKYNHYLEHVYSEWFEEPENVEDEELLIYFKKSGFYK